MNEKSQCADEGHRHFHWVDCGSNFHPVVYQLFDLVGKSLNPYRPLFPHVNKPGILLLSGSQGCTD